MSKFIVNTNFQFGGALRVAGANLTIGDSKVLKEQRKGKHKKTGKPLSGLLNHCEPANDHTVRLLKERKLSSSNEPEDEEGTEEDPEADEKTRLWGQFGELGKAYDKRWNVERLKQELKKVRKETPEPKGRAESIN